VRQRRARTRSQLELEREAGLLTPGMARWKARRPRRPAVRGLRGKIAHEALAVSVRGGAGSIGNSRGAGRPAAGVSQRWPAPALQPGAAGQFPFFGLPRGGPLGECRWSSPAGRFVAVWAELQVYPLGQPAKGLPAGNKLAKRHAMAGCLGNMPPGGNAAGSSSPPPTVGVFRAARRRATLWSSPAPFDPVSPGSDPLGAALMSGMAMEDPFRRRTARPVDIQHPAEVREKALQQPDAQLIGSCCGHPAGIACGYGLLHFVQPERSRLPW